jgi:hypothetical protein
MKSSVSHHAVPLAIKKEYLANPLNVEAFVGSGLGGMGVLNFTLDWSNITSSIMLYPWWTQLIQFVAFVVSVWILVPIAKFNGLCT